jgi:hypothetical protein
LKFYIKTTITKLSNPHLKFLLVTNVSIIEEVLLRLLAKTIDDNGMFVDVDSNNKTGIAGVDYMTTITWNGNSWIRTLAELSADGGVKVVEQNNNFTGFFEKQGSNYVNFFFNLNKIGSPDQYLVAFFVEDRLYSNLDQGIFDFTNWVRIPPSQYVISAFPNSIVLRPGDEKKVELEVKSIALPTRTEPKLYLHVGSQPPEMNTTPYSR